MEHGKLFVVAGPTAVGKGTLVKELRRRYPSLAISVSATTRAPRPGEVDGRDYYFVTGAEFRAMITNHELLEWAQVHGRDFYGTPRAAVAQALAQGRDMLLEIDLAGARQIRAQMPEAVMIFIAPPSFEELRRRLVERGTEDAQAQERRLETARVELAAQAEFDHIVVNAVIDDAVDQLAQIIGLG